MKGAIASASRSSVSNCKRTCLPTRRGLVRGACRSHSQFRDGVFARARRFPRLLPCSQQAGGAVPKDRTHRIVTELLATCEQFVDDPDLMIQVRKVGSEHDPRWA